MRWSLCLLMTLIVPLPLLAQEKENKDNPEDVPEVMEGKVRLALDPGGHTSLITKVFFTPDSQQLITLSTDQSIRIWDVQSGECLNVLYPPRRIFPHLARLSPDGKHLAILRDQREDGKRTFSVLLISLDQGQIERILKAPFTGVPTLAFSHDGKWLATSNPPSKEILLWNMEKPADKPEKTISTPSVPGFLAFSPDGKRLAQSGGWAGILDVEEGKEVRKLFAGAPGDKVVWSPDGKMLAYSTATGVHLWEAEGKARPAIEKSIRFSSVAFSADSKHLLASEAVSPEGQKNARAMLFDMNGKLKKTFLRGPLIDAKPVESKPHPGKPADNVHYLNEAIYDCTLSPDGEMAAAVTRLVGHQQVQLWRTSDGRQLKRFSSPSWYAAPEVEVGWSPDNKMVTVTQNDGSLRAFLFDELPQPKPMKPNEKQKPPIQALRIIGKPPAPAPNIVMMDHGGWHLKKGQSEKEYLIFKGNETKPHATIKRGGNIYHITFFGKDQIVVSGDFGVMDTEAKALRTLQGHGSYVLNFAVSPNRKYIASCSWDQVLCIHTPQGTEPLVSVYVAGKDWVAWTPEGYYAASPGGERLMGWVVEKDPNEMGTFHPASRFHARLYRPDVIRLLLKEGSFDKALAKADAAAGKANAGKQVKVDDVLPPDIKIKIAPKPGTAPKDGKRIIEAEATPSGADPITSLQLQVDGRPYVGETAALITIDKPAKGPVKRTWDVVLPPGKHDVKVLARTDASLGTSRGLSYEREDDKSAKKDPILHILAVGIDEYPPGLKLGGCVNDANNLAEAFKKHSKPPFSDVEVKVLTDKQATRDGMRQGSNGLRKIRPPRTLRSSSMPATATSIMRRRSSTCCRRTSIPRTFPRPAFHAPRSRRASRACRAASWSSSTPAIRAASACCSKTSAAN